MNLYKVLYKRYNNHETCFVAAPTAGEAYKIARSYIKRKYYGDQEVLSVEKTHEIAAVSSK